MSESFQSAEFWRYVDGLKFSCAVAAVESFSTREPASKTLCRLFNAIGNELRTFLDADYAFHFFTNPDLSEVHFMQCGAELQYRKEQSEFRYQFDKDDPLRWRFFAFIQEDGTNVSNVHVKLDPSTSFPSALRNAFGNPQHLVLVPFCKGDTPFGFFVFCWGDKIFPLAFRIGAEAEGMREGGISILNYVHDLVTRLLSNHYPIYRDTYFPAFQQTGTQPVCVLFADIRNFTSAFESSRLKMDDGGAYTRALVGFVKAYLKAASLVIAEPGIGRIDKFIGDGIMATFGEYVVCSGKTKDEEKANKSLVAGLLGLYTSAMLHNAFEKLRDRLFDHPAVKRFLSEFNDSINIELGVGMNYGDVWFDFFGSSGSSEGSDSNFLGGYLEYTAVGDHVNAAQRLESLASKAASAVSLIARGPGREERTPNFIAPIVLSRTVFVRVRGALQPPPKSRGRSLEEHYRSAFALKGKGSVVEAYEVFPDEINGDNLILRLTELTSRKLANSVRKTWLSDKRGFDFDEAIANDLAAKCFPAS